MAATLGSAQFASIDRIDAVAEVIADKRSFFTQYWPEPIISAPQAVDLLALAEELQPWNSLAAKPWSFNGQACAAPCQETLDPTFSTQTHQWRQEQCS